MARKEYEPTFAAPGFFISLPGMFDTPKGIYQGTVDSPILRVATSRGKLRLQMPTKCFPTRTVFIDRDQSKKGAMRIRVHRIVLPRRRAFFLAPGFASFGCFFLFFVFFGRFALFYFFSIGGAKEDPGCDLNTEEDPSHWVLGRLLPESRHTINPS